MDKDFPAPFFQPIDSEQKETLRSSMSVVYYDPPALYLQEVQVKQLADSSAEF